MLKYNMSTTCPFVLLKGDRKGQICGIKNKLGFNHCRYHCQKDSNPEEPVVPGVKNTIDNSYVPQPVIRSSKDQKDKMEKEEDNMFIKSFSQHVDKHITDSEVNMDLIYDFEDGESVDDDEQHDTENKAESTDPEVLRLKKENQELRNQKIKAQNYIHSMFTMKQLMVTGLKVITDTAENYYPDNLKGYTHTVFSSDEINSILDEMSNDLTIMTGYTDFPPYMRLPITLLALGSTTMLKNSSQVTIRKPTQDLPIQQPDQQPDKKVEKSFTPAYKE